MSAVYVIIKGEYPTQYEPVAVAGNEELAKKTAKIFVDDLNREIDIFNKELKKMEGNTGQKIPDYEFRKHLTEKSDPAGYWDNQIEFVMYKKMDLIVE